ncbi:hypothetical protein AC629_28555 [Bradyrhizobium sp. NAS80.1]|uniref:hypothetical protein n=1 Tax=Bradyrhizobium sp. NAS80.1 TaxID=1680159 RepID=UPI00095B9195|nr:hypothetical protein [Bradyrhizobium sp. NAS80.1]OKO79593.1 hypothetical protein AC629_28555 [Bradyrhizobium sp. NAS80.1]
MRIELVQAIVVAVGLGVLVAAWAYLHFHAPHEVETIRRAVSPQRYFWSLSMHICGILAIYVILLLSAYPLMMVIEYGPNDMAKCWICPNCGEDCSADEQAIIWAALISALSVRLLMPNLALTRHILDSMQSLAHRLARFPEARERVVASLAVSGFSASHAAESEVTKELSSYGVSSHAITFLSKGATQSLSEVCLVRRRLQKLSDRSRVPRTLRARISELVLVGFASQRRQHEFWRGRSKVWSELETDFRRLVRRSARALLLIDDTAGQAPEKAEGVAVAVSNFVVEESDSVLTRYRRLIAELVLFSEPYSDRQEKILRSFGYSASIPPTLPIRPWITVFVLDFILFSVPILVTPFSGDASPIPTTPLALFACVHAISQTVAISWAICPKIASNFARPSLYSLPWPSYIVYGIASYLSGAAILFIFRITVPMPFAVKLPTLVSSFSFLLMTVGVSWLIDQHLRSRFDDLRRRRVRDGVVIGLLMLAGTITFQIIIFHIAPWLGWLEKSSPAVEVRAGFLLLSGSLGFVIGYIVPSVAARYLHEASLLPLAYPSIGGRSNLLSRTNIARPTFEGPDPKPVGRA